MEKELLTELMKIKGTKDFAKFGFSTGGPYSKWMKSANNLKTVNKGALIQLAHFYAINGPKETEPIKQLITALNN